MAKIFIDKALQADDKLPQQDKIAKCLHARGVMNRLEGDYNGVLLDYNKSVENKVKDR